MRRVGSRLIQIVVGVLMMALCISPAIGQGESDAKKEGASADETAPTYESVMSKFDKLYRSDSSHASMTMTVDKDGNRRELTLEMWTKGEDYALVVIRKPEREAGTATLRKPEGLWNYAPRADRLIRVPDGLLSDAWMGSHFTNDDLMRETSWDDDYTGQVQRVSRDGEDQLKVTMTPRPDAPVVYTKVIGYFQQDSYTPRLFEYYDGEDRVRTMVFDDVEEVSGRQVPMEMTLYPGRKEDVDEYTQLQYSDLEYGVDIDDRKFSRQGLRREAQR